MDGTLTIEEYLRGFVAVDIPDTALASIFAKRGITRGCAVSDVDDKGRDLSLADLYIYLSTAPSVKNNTEDSDGGWKHTEGGFQIAVADKRAFRAMARELLGKWGEKLSVNTTVIHSI